MLDDTHEFGIVIRRVAEAIIPVADGTRVRNEYRVKILDDQTIANRGMTKLDLNECQLFSIASVEGIAAAFECHAADKQRLQTLEISSRRRRRPRFDNGAIRPLADDR